MNNQQPVPKNIFISYARSADAAFALKIATDLKAYDINAWLDHLDIPPGVKWDRAVEDQLRSADTLLLVLSDAAIRSDNVMDEVSFALEKKKTIIPVLVEECDIPLRLHRLQYIDFTAGYKTGMEKLVQALGGFLQAPGKYKTASSLFSGNQTPGSGNQTLPRKPVPAAEEGTISAFDQALANANNLWYAGQRRTALLEVAKALKLKPGDSKALQLKSKIENDDTGVSRKAGYIAAALSVILGIILLFAYPKTNIAVPVCITSFFVLRWLIKDLF